jgi:hypothetical protein
MRFIKNITITQNTKELNTGCTFSKDDFNLLKITGAMTKNINISTINRLGPAKEVKALAKRSIGSNSQKAIQNIKDSNNPPSIPSAAYLNRINIAKPAIANSPDTAST